MTRTLKLLLASALVVAALAGCEKYTEPYKDAPRSGVVNDDKVDLITNPDGFSNVAAKCDGPNRVYVIYHGDTAYGAIAVVANDPRCTK